MSATENDQQDQNHILSLHEDVPQSPMEALRRKRDEIEAKREILIPLTGYEEIGLQVKYRLLDRSETDQIAKRIRQQTKDRGEIMFRMFIDTMIASCEGFYLASDGGAPEPLEPLEGSGHVQTYAELAQGLGWDGTGNHRQAVLHVFGNNDFSAGQHGMLLTRWMGDTNIDIDSEMLGE